MINQTWPEPPNFQIPLSDNDWSYLPSTPPPPKHLIFITIIISFFCVLTESLTDHHWRFWLTNFIRPWVTFVLLPQRRVKWVSKMPYSRRYFIMSPVICSEHMTLLLCQLYIQWLDTYVTLSSPPPLKMYIILMCVKFCT